MKTRAYLLALLLSRVLVFCLFRQTARDPRLPVKKRFSKTRCWASINRSKAMPG